MLNTTTKTAVMERYMMYKCKELLSKILIWTLYIVLFGTFCMMIATIVYLNDQNTALKADNLRLNGKIAILENTLEDTETNYTDYITALNDDHAKLKTMVTDLNDVITDLDTQLKEAVKSNKSYKKELKVYKEREELYNKYEYCIVYGGKRTDLTYDQIKYGEELMKEKGYDPNLLFDIIMVESRGTETAKNKHSTAKGYTQMLNGTAKFVYEDLLNKGTFYESYSLDGYKNIEMCVGYLDYLIKRRNSLTGVIMSYSGRNSQDVQWYLREMNKFSNINQIAANIY